MMMRLRLRHWAWAVLPVLIVTFLGGARLTYDMLWFDEVGTLAIIGLSDNIYPVELPHILWDRWPPLFSGILFIWARLVGTSELALRYLPLLFGMLTVSAIYRLARDLWNAQTGLLAATLLSTSAFFVYYTHEQRGYTLYALFTTLFVLTYWRLLTTHSVKIMHRWLFRLSVAGLLYTHLIAATTIAVVGIYHLISQRGHKRFALVLRLMIQGGLFFVPWIPLVLLSVRGESGDPRGLPLGTIVRTTLYAYHNGLIWFPLLIWAYVAVFIRGRAMRLLAFWTIGVLIMAIGANVVLQYLFHIRHIFSVHIPLALLVAVAIADLWRRFAPLGIAVLGIWVVFGIVGWSSMDFMERLPGQEPIIPLEAVQTIIETIDQCAKPDDRVVVHLENGLKWLQYQNLRYYTQHQTVVYSHVEPMVAINLYGETYEDHTDTFADGVRQFTQFVPQTWLFELRTIPESIRVDEFRSVMHDKTDYCYQVIDTVLLSGQVYTDEPFTCQPTIECNP